ncbi:hypothetical protein F5Y15DRAFT_401624 [Xylariaceae sp. FL0016]|nr:hypothetical protein F5Y15DRAFT_401624 [Xylariaceae sp. FL0016]
MVLMRLSRRDLRAESTTGASRRVRLASGQWWWWRACRPSQPSHSLKSQAPQIWSGTRAVASLGKLATRFRCSRRILAFGAHWSSHTANDLHQVNQLPRRKSWTDGLAPAPYLVIRDLRPPPRRGPIESPLCTGNVVHYVNRRVLCSQPLLCCWSVPATPNRLPTTRYVS